MAVKTFVRPFDAELVREACLREFKRGGQVYFLHNKVETIERVAHDLAQLLPEATLRVAHGQMPERELERIMADFHHRRFNLLVCTTIVESGIDVPTANTIIIDRADNLGLAQLHQLRGRVGRSHHQAYAYLMVPSRDALKGDALKRLEAIESLGELGIGFTLASHDMEIRGAGELLGDEQTGHIQEIGFTLFNELLERAVRDIRAGRTPDFDAAVRHEIDINLGSAALLPNDYVPDVHQRLVLYKRVAGASDLAALEDLQVELVDRFGPLPAQAGLLFAQARLRITARALGVTAITGGEHGFTISFTEQPAIDVEALLKLIRSEPKTYRFDGRSKLTATVDTDTVQARLDAVEALLDRLTPRQAAAAAGRARA
jgi:transcription-repair coupling factor (superfamily II helicase)